MIAGPILIDLVVESSRCRSTLKYNYCRPNIDGSTSTSTYYHCRVNTRNLGDSVVTVSGSILGDSEVEVVIFYQN